MNRIKTLLTAIFFLAGITVVSAQAKTETIKVSGNCGMCRKHIETAAKKAGASKAKWDKKTKVLTVSYDGSMTSNEAIQQSVAAAGYDTEKFAGDQKAYNALDECCQYDGKKKVAAAK